MPEITSFMNKVPTLQKKRTQQPATIAKPQHKSPAPAPLLRSQAGDSVHFTGSNKRRRTDDGAGPSHRNDTPEPESSTEGGSEDDLFPPPNNNRRGGAASIIPLLFGDVDPFSRPLTNPGLAMREHIKPLDEDDGDDEWKAYQEPAAPYANKLTEITSRSYLNNAVLRADDEQMKKAILMKLKQQSPDKHLFTVNCAPDNLDKLERRYKGPALPHIFSEPAYTMGLPADKPTVLLLKNTSPADAQSLQGKEAFQRIKKQNPHFRFVISQPHLPKGGEEDHPLAAILNGLEGRSKSTDTRRAPFANVHVNPLNTQQWAQVMKEDKQVNEILGDYDLKFPTGRLNKFLDKLQKSQAAPLDREQILGEVDSLASFIRMQKKDDNGVVTNNHIAEYTKHLQTDNSKAVVKTNSGGLSSNPLEQKPYKMVKASDIKTRLNDVVGHDHAKAVLSQALEAIKYPNLYDHLNEGDKDASNNNVLLMGEPGGGKSMLAEAIAGEGKGAFISTTGSQFVNVYVGMGANNMRQLKAAIEQAPDDLVVVFMDEIDSLGSRGNKGPIDGGGSREETQTINEFLAMTEGVNSSGHNKKILLIGATNHPENLDKGIQSRFHYKETIGKLDGKQRKLLMEKQLKEKKLELDKSVDLESLVRQTEGLSGRDLRNVMKLAKQSLIRQMPEADKIRLEHDAKARKEFKLTVTQHDLETALKEVKEGWKGINPGQVEPNEDSLSHLYM